MKVSVNEVTKATFEAIISTILAVLFSVFMIHLLQNTVFIYPFIVICIFMMFYFKIFSYKFSNFALIVCVSLYFWATSDNFESLMILRLKDMCMGFVIACLVSYFVFPFKNSQRLKPLISEILISFSEVCKLIIKNQKTGEFTTINSQILKSSTEFKRLFKSPLYDDFIYTQKDLINLRSYALKNGLNNDLTKDINELKSRYEMLYLKLNSKSYYFKNELNSSNQTIKNLLILQNEIYLKIY